MTKYFPIVALLFVLFSCHQGTDKQGTAMKTDTTAAPSQEGNGESATLKNLSYAYNRDPACGMPLKAGLEDTTTYKGKLYGFCSKECKEEFLKDPAGYVAKIK